MKSFQQNIDKFILSSFNLKPITMTSQEGSILNGSVPKWLNNIIDFYFDLIDKQTKELFKSMEDLRNSSDESMDKVLIKESNKLNSATRLTTSFFKNYSIILLPAVSKGITEWVSSMDSKITSEKKIKSLRKMIEQILEQIEGAEDKYGLNIAQQELLSLLDEVKKYGNP